MNKCCTNENKIRTFIMKLTIPYYLHKAGAGFPSPATDYIEEDIDLNIHLIKNVPATFIIRVQGKSMVGVGINDGDLLVVDKSLKPKNFSTVIANVHDELVVKSYVKERDNEFLTSGSKKFDVENQARPEKEEENNLLDATFELFANAALLPPDQPRNSLRAIPKKLSLLTGKDEDAATICVADLTAIAHRLDISISDLELAQMIADADCDGDGSINREEFKRIMIFMGLCDEDDRNAV